MILKYQNTSINYIFPNFPFIEVAFKGYRDFSPSLMFLKETERKGGDA